MPVEIAFSSTGSVSDFIVSPGCTSDRLYKRGVLDISVSRAFAVTPPRHFTVPVPLYSKWHETHKGVHRSACCERFANRFLTKAPGLWSSEQVRDLQSENRQDECSQSLTVPLFRIVPSKFHWHRTHSIPRHLLPEVHEVRRWYTRGNVHARLSGETMFPGFSERFVLHGILLPTWGLGWQSIVPSTMAAVKDVSVRTQAAKLGQSCTPCVKTKGVKVTSLLSTESRLGDFVVERCIFGNLCSPRWYLPRGRV